MKHRLLCALTIIIIIIIIGLHQKGVAFFEYTGPQEGNFVIEIQSEPEEKDYYNVYQGTVNNKKFLIYIKKSEEKLSYGDKIEATASFNKASGERNKGCFNYDLYLKTKKIYGIFKVEDVGKIDKAETTPFIIKVQKYLKQNFQNNLKKDNANLAIGLLLGDRSDISEDVQNNFKDANLTHILAISGAHFSYIILITTWITKKLKNKKLEKILLLVAIVFFIKLTGQTPSVLRAGIMSIITILASILKRKNDIYTSLSLSLIIQEIINPYAIFDLGLILSYSGVIGIVTFYRFIHRKIKLKIVSITLAANVLIIPIMIYNFNTISFTFIISNVFASGLLGIIIILEIITSIFRFKPLFIVLDISLSILTKIADLCSKLPFSKVYVTNKFIWVVLLAYLAIYLICKMKKKSIPILISIALVFNVAVLIDKKGVDNLQINFIDVGQGDCTLLINKGTSLMIDTGGNANSSYDGGEKILHRYLLYNGINHLDYMMLSHFDADHCQNGIFLLKNMKVKNLIIGKQPETSELYEEITAIAREKNINVIYVQKGDSLKIKNMNIKILHPSDKFITENPLNNNALVCKITYYNFKLLFTGDIEKLAEETLIGEDLKADLLKVGHHGSKTSTTQEFLDKVDPKIALIGVGENNKFGHPNEGVIERLEEKNIKIFRTDQNGEINLVVKPNFAGLL